MNKHRIISILTLILSFSSVLNAQAPQVFFDHITSENGLGSSTVQCVQQDHQGFIWIATSGGIYRYDGYKLKGFFTDPKNDSSLVDNRLNSLLVDRDDDIFIGTWESGLSIYNHNTERFTNYTAHDAKESIKSNAIKTLFEDSKGYIWIGMSDEGGLARFDKKSKEFKAYQIPADNNCYAITEDKNGLLWLCSETKGLYTLDPNTDKFTFIQLPNLEDSVMSGATKRMLFDTEGSLWIATWQGSGLYRYNPSTGETKNWSLSHPQLRSKDIRDLLEYEPGKFWLATDGEGLVWMDVQTETFVHHKNKSDDPNSINTNAVYSLFLDNTNIMWVGTFNGGVNIYDQNKTKFKSERPDTQNEFSLSHKAILCAIEDDENNIWIGTDGGGLNRFTNNKLGGQFTHYLPNPSQPNSSAPAVVKSLFIDWQGDIWFGTWARGMGKFNPKTGLFDYSINKTANITNEGGIWSMAQIDSSYIWASYLGHGLRRINLKDGSYKEYSPQHGGGITESEVLHLMRDSKNRLWAASEGAGVFQYIASADSFKVYANDIDIPSSLGGAIVRTSFEDSKGRIWFGFLGHGLSLYNEEHDNFTNLTTADGLISNTINAIEEDNDGFLWIATNRGIMKFDPETRQVKRYDKYDGLQDNEFTYGASCKLHDGNLLFGGVNGLNIFDPTHIKDNSFLPPVVITGLSIFNKPVSIGDDTNVLKQSLQTTNAITFLPDHSVITLTFSALSFTHSQKNQYAYMLEPFEKEWNYVGDKKDATYTNLDPGKYTFRVKASNNDGVWNEEGSALKIIILPPFWKTWWFRISVSLSLILLVAAFFRYRIKALKAQKAELEEKVKQRTKELSKSNELLTVRQEVILQQTEELQQQTEELTVQKDILSSQKDELSYSNKKISEQNMHIKASVTYAQTLQNAILPSLAPLNANYEHFTIYKPKDIVSGDFFWFENLSANQGLLDKFILSVIDCTGHGVPGAFMTLVADRLLHEAVVEHKIEDPALILNELDHGVQKMLKQNTTENKDGMDLVVCLFERTSQDTVKLVFSGSKNPLFYYKNETKEIVRINSDKRHIGRVSSKIQDTEFTNHIVELNKGDVAFLSTDGYIDQNNENRTRLGTKLYTSYLEEIAELPTNEMKAILEKYLSDWQGTEAQRDDISIVGIRV